jgi:hypothetical protein
MTRVSVLKHEFVEYIPSTLADGVIYISIEFATAVHKCCCGCGQKVVTPLSPTDWKLIFDGETVTLDPSIGNWSLPCKSHYWVQRNAIRWSRKWTPAEIRATREHDALLKQQQFGQPRPTAATMPAADGHIVSERKEGFVQRWKKRLFGSRS